MKTKILNFSESYTAFVVAGVALIIFAFVTVLVHAQVVPTVDTSIHNESHNVIATANIGSIVHDSVTVASTTGPTPTGTVDFRLYPNTTCFGTPTKTELGVLLVSGTVESATTTMPNTGLSYKVHYNGQGDVYAPNDANCEPLIATASATTLLTTLSTSTPVLAGSSVFDTSTLGSATASSTGTVVYTVYSDNACTQSFITAGTKTVVDGIVPNSDLIQFNTVGTYYWQAHYSGDGNNSQATSTCQSEVLHVLATTTPPIALGSISGMVYDDFNRNGLKDVGDTGLSGWTINLYSGAGWWGPHHNSPIWTAVSDSNGNYSFGNLADGTYSIEEINKVGWTQITGDYNSVVVTGGAHIINMDFGDASSTKKNDDDNNDDDHDHNDDFFKNCKDHFKNFFEHFKAHNHGHDNGHNNKNDKGDNGNDKDD